MGSPEPSWSDIGTDTDAVDPRPREIGRRASHPSPPLVFAIAVVGAVALAMVVPEPEVASGPWRLPALVVGGVLVLAGTGLHVGAWRAFRSRETTVQADGTPRSLVTDGPYARTRNPMYLAGIVILLGLALLLGALASFLGAVAYGAVAHAFFLPAEERTMEARFGSAYLDYRASVPTWIGPSMGSKSGTTHR